MADVTNFTKIKTNSLQVGTTTVTDLNQIGSVSHPVSIITAGATLTAADNNKRIILNKAASDVIVLPDSTANPGFEVVVAFQVATTSGVGHIIRPAGTDVMRATFITTPASAKGAQNTQATAKIGDAATFVSDGAGAWYVTSSSGTWTRET